jgi:hypothetical protein
MLPIALVNVALPDLTVAVSSTTNYYLARLLSIVFMGKKLKFRRDDQRRAGGGNGQLALTHANPPARGGGGEDQSIDEEARIADEEDEDGDADASVSMATTPSSASPASALPVFTDGNDHGNDDEEEAGEADDEDVEGKDLDALGGKDKDGLVTLEELRLYLGSLDDAEDVMRRAHMYVRQKNATITSADSFLSSSSSSSSASSSSSVTGKDDGKYTDNGDRDDGSGEPSTVSPETAVVSGTCPTVIARSDLHAWSERRKQHVRMQVRGTFVEKRYSYMSILIFTHI